MKPQDRFKRHVTAAGKITWYFYAFRTTRRGFKTKREAQLAYLELEKSNRFKKKIIGSSDKFSYVANCWFEDYKLLKEQKESTYDKRYELVATLNRWIGDLELDKLTPEYLEKFSLPGQCIMDEKGLEAAGYDVLRTMSQENVRYAEIRFAPLLSETSGMNCRAVIEAVLKGLERGRADFGTEFGVITCAMRHHSQEDNSRMIKTAREYLGYGVCAADLAGAEAAYPMAQFMELFQNTRKLEMPFTLHAGECGSVQNIVDAVKAGAGRIGHGIAMRGHYNIQKELADRGIGIEMCPISNLQTKAVNSPSEYPIREFLNTGLKVSINTDNRTVSNTSLTKELQFIQDTYGIQEEEIRLMMKNAVDTAFATDEVKERLYSELGIKG